MDYLILVLATLCASGKALFCKAVGSAKGRAVFSANFKSFSIAAVIALCFAAKELKNIFSVSPFTLLLSAAFAFAVFFTQLMQMKAMASGPASLTTLIYSSAFLIPIIFGAIVWREPISAVQYVGIAVMLIALFLIVWNRGERVTDVKWLIFAVLAALGSGTIAIIQKIHQLSEHSGELVLFLFLALSFCAVLSLFAYLVYRPRTAVEAEIQQDKGEKQRLYRLSPIPLGICVGLLNFLNLTLAGRIPSVIQFPVYNVGSLIITFAVSVTLFKERLGIQKILGCIFGVAAIVMIGMF